MCNYATIQSVDTEQPESKVLPLTDFIKSPWRKLCLSGVCVLLILSI